MSHFKKINVVDLVMLLTVFISAFGFFLARSSHAGVDKVITDRPKVAMDVLIVGLKTLDCDIFKVGDKANLTIRNQPIEPALTIDQVKTWPRLITFLGKDGKTPIAVPDIANAYAHDFLITLLDNAETTKDGYVICGNKLKIGNQVELESFKYRVQGVVVNIREVKN